ncbi:flagellar export chaperone FlgN [Shewanella sp. GXUN23E]|uniref:flagellar export chaperone FlgN n=1 Tax=Shewanella sp. GXUN23E TaxID=3422498 RepID=UPI003D7D9A0B
MADKKTLLQALIRGITQDVADYQQLQQLLASQRQLMLGRDNEALLEHNRHQDALVTRLSQSAEQRSQLLQAIGVSADGAGMDKLLRALPGAVALQVKDRWQQLLALGQSCQAANEQNGRLLVRQQELIRDLLHSQPKGAAGQTPYPCDSYAAR